MSLCRREVEIGDRKAEYEEGIDFPSALVALRT